MLNLIFWPKAVVATGQVQQHRCLVLKISLAPPGRFQSASVQAGTCSSLCHGSHSLVHGITKKRELLRAKS